MGQRPGAACAFGSLPVSIRLPYVAAKVGGKLRQIAADSFAAANTPKTPATVSAIELAVEALHMMRKGQVKRLKGRDAVGQMKFVESLFGIAA